MNFCETCNDWVSVQLEEVELSHNIRGIEYKYVGKRAICSKCNREVWSPEVRDYNLSQLDNAYKTSQGK